MAILCKCESGQGAMARFVLRNKWGLEQKFRFVVSDAYGDLERDDTSTLCESCDNAREIDRMSTDKIVIHLDEDILTLSLEKV